MSIPRSDSLSISLPGDRFTPYTLARKLGALAILESVSYTGGRDRYSLLMLSEAFRIRQDAQTVTMVVDGQEISSGATDILDVLYDVAAQNMLQPEGIPVPGSGMGYLGYEFCARCDTITLAPQTDDLLIPEALFIVGHVYIVFDHFTDRLHIIGLNYDQHQIDLQKELDDIREKLEDLDFSYMQQGKALPEARLLTDEESSRSQFMDGVGKLRKHIIAGDFIQAVLSRRVQLKSDAHPLDVYRSLRSANPSPYLFYLDFGTFCLVGASPENLVRVRDGIASIRPIAGTRRRGKSPEEDAVLEKELLSDPKERAEHLMLVDLARNDLGRICIPGSVRLVKTMEIEHFSHVMHICSEVSGQLPVRTADDKRPPSLDVLRAAFPAGTVSGAPKIRAIETLSTMEPTRRSFYAGAVGYMEPDGDFDFCIALRSALVQGNTWTIQAGAGIVYDSKPEREWEETNEKLRAMRKVLEGGGK